MDFGLTSIQGGKLTNNDTLVNIGLQLTDACWNTYASTAYVLPTAIYSCTDSFLPVPALVLKSSHGTAPTLAALPLT